MSFNIPPMEDYFRALDETFAQARSGHSLLLPMINEIDAFYRQEVFVRVENANPLAVQLCLNAHLLLLATARQALSGHPNSVFPLGRTALESACYAYLIMTDESLGDVWLRRDESPQHMKDCRGKFGQAVSEVAKHISQDVASLGKLVSDLYQNLINYGAHPNSKSVTDYMHFNEEDEQGLIPVVLGGLYAVNDQLTLRGGLAYIETSLITALVVCGALGAGHPLLQEGSTRFHDLFALKGELFDQINGN